MGAWHLATVPVGGNLPDLAKAQAERLAGPNEPEPVDRLGLVVTVPRPRATRRRKDSDLFIVADRLHRDAGPLGDLSDAHLFMIRLDSPPNWRVYHPGGGSPGALERPATS